MEQHQISRHTVSRETFSKSDALLEKYRSAIEEYLDLLLWWNRRINLVSRDVSRETLMEHVRHSLLLVQFEAFQEAGLIVDAGTGGGLPGIPLAIASPEKQFILNDIVSKKVIALREMVRMLGLDQVVCQDRPVERLSVDDPFLLISKHAFKINQLWRMVNDKPWVSMVFYKGLNFEIELEEIDEPLNLECHDLSNGSEFYKGKALVVINK